MKSVDPNFDFYQYSNGNWLADNPIPPEYSRWSIWNEVIDRNNEKLRIILEQAAQNISAAENSNETSEKPNIEHEGITCPLVSFTEVSKGVKKLQKSFKKL